MLESDREGEKHKTSSYQQKKLNKTFVFSAFEILGWFLSGFSLAKRGEINLLDSF